MALHKIIYGCCNPKIDISFMVNCEIFTWFSTDCIAETQKEMESWQCVFIVKLQRMCTRMHMCAFCARVRIKTLQERRNAIHAHHFLQEVHEMAIKKGNKFMGILRWFLMDEWATRVMWDQFAVTGGNASGKD